MKQLLTFSVTVFLGGCVYQNFGDTCQFPSDVPFYEAELSALSLIIVSPHFSDTDAPFLSLYDHDNESALAVELIELEQHSSGLIGATTQYCRDAETREYLLAVDQQDWTSYWVMAREAGRFSVGVAVPGLEPPVRSNSFGFALYEKSSRDPAWVCGCLAR